MNFGTQRLAGRARTRGATALLVLGLGALGAASLSACGSSSSSSSAQAGGKTASATTSSGAIPKLKVAVPVLDPVLGDVFLAQTLGFYTKAGVDVTIDNAGADVVTSVVSGQADVGMSGTGVAFLPVVQGKPTSIIYNFLQSPQSAALAVAKTSSYQTLADLAGKRVGVLGTGTASYGYAQVYNAYLRAHGKAPMTVVTEATGTGETDALISGGLDAVVAARSFLSNPTVAPKVRLLIDPATSAGVTELSQTFHITPYAEDSIFGSPSVLSSNRVAVVRFLEAVAAADKWMKSASPDAVGQSLQKYPGFSAIGTADQLAAAVKVTHPFVTSTGGYISPALWAATLKGLKTWQLTGVNIASSTWSYKNRVNMTYLKAGKPLS